MKRDLPIPRDILEELVDNTAAQIERLATVAFGNAMDEMLAYHRFLLALNASRTADGSAVSFSEVMGDAWIAPHTDWVRQYGRLFERAANRLRDDDHFVRALSYLPNRLLPEPSDVELPANVIHSVLGLGPMMTHRLGQWLSKGAIARTDDDSTSHPTMRFDPRDTQAFENVLPEIIGAWEGLLDYIPTLYGWRGPGELNDVGRWSLYRKTWPFLWQHLMNTAYSLAISTWNEDENGTIYFRNSLLRWPKNFQHHFSEETYLRDNVFLFPDILELEWPEASTAVSLLTFDYFPQPSPEQVLASIISIVHKDVLLLSAAVFLFWTINQKASSKNTVRNVRALLHRENSDERYREQPTQDLEFCSLALDFLRLKITGRRFEDRSYAAHLDGLVARLDGMTERTPVPGRVYKPSTLHQTDDLLLAVVAILVSATPNNGDDGLVDSIRALSEEGVLPEGDKSLRSVVRVLARWRTILEPEQHLGIIRSASIVAPDNDNERGATRLREIILSLESVIGTERLKQLIARPVNAKKLESIRSGIEFALLNRAPAVPYFTDVHIACAVANESVEWYGVTFDNIPKGELTEPPMVDPSLNLDERLVSSVEKAVERNAVDAFANRPRKVRAVGAWIMTVEFWGEIAPLVQEVGSDPVLVVSRTRDAQILRRLRFAASSGSPQLQISKSSRLGNASSYIATIEGVDVFEENIAPGKAWLVSARALNRVVYLEHDSPGRYVEVCYEPSDERNGSLRVRFKQLFGWSESPIFELCEPEEDES